MVSVTATLKILALNSPKKITKLLSSQPEYKTVFSFPIIHSLPQSPIFMILQLGESFTLKRMSYEDTESRSVLK
jgi:hypothetical protein